MTRRGGFRWRGLALVALVAAVLAVLRPWTIRPIATAMPAEFEAASYVASIWASRVLPEAERSAVDIAVAIRGRPSPPTPGGPPPRRSVFVKGTALVTELDRRSQVGLARMRIDAGGSSEAAIQIGPVLRGTGLRDALEFIRFTDFVNQIEFASVSNALNDRIAKEVLAPIDLEQLAGRRIRFVGVVTLGAAPADAPLEILPVQIELLGDDR